VSKEEILEKKRQEYERRRENYSWMPEWKGEESVSWLE
jgi:hypothetical protein